MSIARLPECERGDADSKKTQAAVSDSPTLPHDMIQY